MRNLRRIREHGFKDGYKKAIKERDKEEIEFEKLGKKQLIKIIKRQNEQLHNQSEKNKMHGKIISDLNLEISKLKKKESNTEIEKLKHEIALRNHVIHQLKKPYKNLDIYSKTGQDVVMFILTKLERQNYISRDYVYFIKKSLDKQKSLNKISLANPIEKQFLANKEEIEIVK